MFIEREDMLRDKVKKIFILIWVSLLSMAMLGCDKKEDDMENVTVDKVVNNDIEETSSNKNEIEKEETTKDTTESVTEEVKIEKILKSEKKYASGITLNNVTEYDINGNKIKYSDYDTETGEIEEEIDWKYDNMGNAVSEKVYNAEYEATYMIEYYREYDEHGKQTVYKESTGWGEVLDECITDWEYDINNRVIKQVDYDIDKKIILTREWEYDETGNMVRESTVDYSCGDFITEWVYNDGQVVKKTEVKDYDESRMWTYNDEGETVIQQVPLDYRGKDIEIVTIYEYDTSGNNTKTIVTNADGQQEMEVNEYDSENRLIKCIYYLDSKKGRSVEYEYDNDDNLVKETIYTGKDNIMKIREYIYDSNGNQIKGIAYDGEGNINETVEFEYYE